MYDCHDDMVAFEGDEVSLPGPERTNMRNRRNANRDRLKSRLKAAEEPTPVGCRSQGSYAMRTMVQDSVLDYDIDDGVYFDRDKLKDDKGSDRSSADIKKMVCTALQDDRFKNPPKVMKTCVRVFYPEGYHVDVPAYRREKVGDKYVYQVASTDWKDSDPLEVTRWFDRENKSRSANTENDGQMRRVVRLIKAFARSRDTWKAKTATGLMISKLVTECFSRDENREDRSLRDAMQSIYNRLMRNEVIAHPTVQGQNVTKDGDTRQIFLRDKLEWALGELKVLDKSDCTQEQARTAWDSVFNSSYFRDRGESKKVTSAAILKENSAFTTPSRPVDPRGGERYG